MTFLASHPPQAGICVLIFLFISHAAAGGTSQECSKPKGQNVHETSNHNHEESDSLKIFLFSYLRFQFYCFSIIEKYITHEKIFSFCRGVCSKEKLALRLRTRHYAGLLLVAGRKKLNPLLSEIGKQGFRRGRELRFCIKHVLAAFPIVP